MTTTDPTPLQERIARALWERNYPTIPWDTEGRRRGQDGFQDDAAAVLPIVAAEVRKAKAEAWDEAHEIGWNNADEYWRCDGLIPSYSKADTYPKPYRETGDSDEHR